MNAAGPYYRLQAVMTAFRAVVAGDFTSAELQKRAFRLQRALRLGVTEDDDAEAPEDAQDKTLDEVVAAYFDAGWEPGSTVTWEVFLADVRMALGPKARTRGHSRRSIQRSVARAKAERSGGNGTFGTNLGVTMIGMQHHEENQNAQD